MDKAYKAISQDDPDLEADYKNYTSKEETGPALLGRRHGCVSGICGLFVVAESL